MIDTFIPKGTPQSAVARLRQLYAAVAVQLNPCATARLHELLAELLVLKESNMGRDFYGNSLKPGVNVDRIDIHAGLIELSKFYANAPVETVKVIEHALMRWARGEEEAAQRLAIDSKFHGIDLTGWYRVLAAARVAGEAIAHPKPMPNEIETATKD